MPWIPVADFKFILTVTRAWASVRKIIFSMDMRRHGASPCWMMYIGVNDVDACVRSVVAPGDAVQMPAFDIPDIGRIAMVSDPQWASFYVMRGFNDVDSTAYDPNHAGHGARHEWRASDGPKAADFYTAKFG